MGTAPRRYLDATAPTDDYPLPDGASSQALTQALIVGVHDIANARDLDVDQLNTLAAVAAQAMIDFSTYAFQGVEIEARGNVIYAWRIRPEFLAWVDTEAQRIAGKRPFRPC